MRLNASANKALKDPAVAERMKEFSATIVGSTPDELAADVRPSSPNGVRWSRARTSRWNGVCGADPSGCVRWERRQLDAEQPILIKAVEKLAILI